MLFIETDLAIYKRLTGYPLDSKGFPLRDTDNVPINREIIGPPGLYPVENLYDSKGNAVPLLPTLPSYGIQVPLMVAPFRGQQGLTSRNPDAVRAFTAGFDPAVSRVVPVFDQNVTGRKYDDIWPCVTFRWIDTQYEARTFVYHDPFRPADTTSPAVSIKNADGDIVAQGFESSNARPHPESWSPYYMIAAHAKSLIELELISHQIMYMFPGKGAITIQFQDGTRHTCDMLLERTDTLDPGGYDLQMSDTGEEQREFHRAFIYVIEGYLDNTTNQFGMRDVRSEPNILSRVLEISDFFTGLVLSTEALEDQDPPESGQPPVGGFIAWLNPSLGGSLVNAGSVGGSWTPGTPAQVPTQGSAPTFDPNAFGVGRPGFQFQIQNHDTLKLSVPPGTLNSATVAQMTVIAVCSATMPTSIAGLAVTIGNGVGGNVNPGVTLASVPGPNCTPPGDTSHYAWTFVYFDDTGATSFGPQDVGAPRVQAKYIVVGVVSGGTVSMYVNGALAGTAAAPSGGYHVNQIVVGADTDAASIEFGDTQDFLGPIGHVLVYSRSLSLPEIQATEDWLRSQ